jgi:archaellum component FlaC
MQEKQEQEAAAAEQKRRDNEAIEQAIPQLNAIFDKALVHLTPSHNRMTSSSGSGASDAPNFVEDVKELDELLQDLCLKVEALAARVPQLKSVEKAVEPCLQRLLEAINKNREQCSPLWLDDATPSTCSSFVRCFLPCHTLNFKPLTFLH